MSSKLLLCGRLLPNFDRFLRVLRRRFRFARLLEHVGLGLLAACGLAVPLIALLYERNASLIVPAIFCLLLGIIAGGAWGIARLPSLLETAMEADRQFNMADLLGSALLVRASAEVDPWSASLLAAAEAQATALTASSVLLRRMGVRAWSGIGLAALLVLTFVFLAGGPDDAKDQVGTRAAETNFGPLAAAGGRPLLDLTLRDADQTRSQHADVEDEQRPGSVESDASAPVQAPSNRLDPTHTIHSHGSSITTPDGKGGGAGRTDAPHGAAEQQRLNATRGQSAAHNGRPSGGTGESGDDRDPSDHAASGVTANSLAANKHVAPWEDGDWQRNVQRAREAVDSGQVPSAYRDLVRDFFDRGMQVQ